MRRAAAVLLLLAGCASPVKGPADRDSVRREPPSRQAPNPCFNQAYGFTCTLPSGFLITDEAAGPGKIMTLMRRSRTRSEEATISLRAYPLDGKTLEWLVKQRVFRPFERARGVTNIKMRPATVGNRQGLEVTFLRQYANGSYAQRFLGFQENENAFIAQMAVPVDRLEKERGALDAFVDSLTFR